MNVAYNMDCMEAMGKMPDKCFDLAIVDPPYGIGCSTFGCGSRERKYDRSKNNKWDSAIPTKKYFDELFRVSKNQIIFGMNYFPGLLAAKEFVVWDKKQPDGVTFAQAELIWTSFNGTSKIYRQSARAQGNRIHQAQKPIEIYEWLLRRYAKTGDAILDTHLGSGSSRIAAYNLGFDFTGYEIDKDYFDAQEKRFEEHTSQYDLFHKED